MEIIVVVILGLFIGLTFILFCLFLVGLCWIHPGYIEDTPPPVSNRY